MPIKKNIWSLFSPICMGSGTYQCMLGPGNILTVTVEIYSLSFIAYIIYSPINLPSLVSPVNFTCILMFYIYDENKYFKQKHDP